MMYPELVSTVERAFLPGRGHPGEGRNNNKHESTHVSQQERVLAINYLLWNESSNPSVETVPLGSGAVLSQCFSLP